MATNVKQLPGSIQSETALLSINITRNIDSVGNVTYSANLSYGDALYLVDETGKKTMTLSQGINPKYLPYSQEKIAGWFDKPITVDGIETVFGEELCKILDSDIKEDTEKTKISNA